jgi:hypothetical protein
MNRRAGFIHRVTDQQDGRTGVLRTGIFFLMGVAICLIGDGSSHTSGAWQDCRCKGNSPSWEACVRHCYAANGCRGDPFGAIYDQGGRLVHNGHDCTKSGGQANVSSSAGRSPASSSPSREKSGAASSTRQSTKPTGGGPPPGATAIGDSMYKGSLPPPGATTVRGKQGKAGSATTTLNGQERKCFGYDTDGRVVASDCSARGAFIFLNEPSAPEPSHTTQPDDPGPPAPVNSPPQQSRSADATDDSCVTNIDSGTGQPCGITSEPKQILNTTYADGTPAGRRRRRVSLEQFAAER